MAMLRIAALVAAIAARIGVLTAAAPGCCEAERLGVVGWRRVCFRVSDVGRSGRVSHGKKKRNEESEMEWTRRTRVRSSFLCASSKLQIRRQKLHTRVGFVAQF
jgi:hypothetical protein